MKTIDSAGGIVVRKQNNEWEVLLVQDMNNIWTFPKGQGEPREDNEASARREIREEVGLSGLTILSKLPSIHYTYHKDGLISKTVHYFLFLLNTPQTLVSQKEEGIHNAQWMRFKKALEIIGYPKTNRPLLEKAFQFIQDK